MQSGLRRCISGGNHNQMDTTIYAASCKEKPHTFNGDLQKLPAALDELKLKNNWVLWKWKWDGKRWMKPPYQITDAPAKVDDPTTWNSYDKVIKAFAANTKFDGIGFNLLGSGYAAFDLDKCRDLKTEELTESARKIINQVDSYQEISPSGTGIRIIGKAANTEPLFYKHNGVEVYRNRKRYITITGNSLNGITKLNNIDGYVNAYSTNPTNEGDEPKQTETTNQPNSNTLLAGDIMTKQFDPIKWILPPFITEGCILFVGRPKIGKSWLALQIGMAISAGALTLGEKCLAGDVLYCALEDNERRLQDRMKMMAAAGVKMDGSKLSFVTQMKRLDDGGLAFLKDWVKSVTNPRLIIIDCLACVRPPTANKQTAYDADYAALEGLRHFANKHKVGIIIVHHDRKLDSDCPFDSVSGTLALNGVADTIIIMKKESDGAVLHARGRDIPSVEKAISNGGEVMWQMVGDAMQLRISEHRKQILDVMSKTPKTPKQIAKDCGLKPDAVRQLLNRMHNGGIVKKEGHGNYYIDGDCTIAASGGNASGVSRFS
jgi:hypothetical protein